MKYFTVTFRRELTYSLFVEAETQAKAEELCGATTTDDIEDQGGIAVHEPYFIYEVGKEVLLEELRDYVAVARCGEEAEVEITTVGELRAAEAKGKV